MLMEGTQVASGHRVRGAAEAELSHPWDCYWCDCKVFFLGFCCTMPGNFAEPLTLCNAESMLREKEYSEVEKLGRRWELLYLFTGACCACPSLQARYCGILPEYAGPRLGFPSGSSSVWGEGGGEGNLT